MNSTQRGIAIAATAASAVAAAGVVVAFVVVDALINEDDRRVRAGLDDES